MSRRKLVRNSSERALVPINRVRKKPMSKRGP
ncbi:hypothetical protein Gorai_012515 [Gossypium raimondii]|uniref:Uncharacterized protein n=1 Tax=Gossypium raimondii TaxID=29730 RepID=A0A7J8Q281_GOSRA|nr:hypothetical protein [Gossypium raimondii]